MSGTLARAMLWMLNSMAGYSSEMSRDSHSLLLASRNRVPINRRLR